jgi:HlyD family secretion protein
MTRRRIWVGGALILLVAAAVARLTIQVMTAAGEGRIPTTHVARGDIEVAVRTQGDLRAIRSGMLVAPSTGGSLQIVRIAPSGTYVKAGEPVIDFDTSEQEFNVAQSESELGEAEQEIRKLTRDAAVQAAQDRVGLLHARFDVRRAELDLQDRDLVGAIEAKKDEMALEEAKRRLTQLEEDVHSRTATSRAGLAVVEQKRNKAQLARLTAKRNIDQMRVLAPFDGLVVVKDNLDAMGGIFMMGMSLPEYREGDSVSPGRVVAEVTDGSAIEVLARIGEADRAYVNGGDRARVAVDPVPGVEFPATVQSVSGMVSRRGPFESDGQRQFDAVFRLDGGDPRLRPGVTALVTVTAPPLTNVLHLPREAVFDVDGRPFVYAKSGRGFEAQPIKVRLRTESRVVVDGLEAGLEVALVNPIATGRRAGSSPAAPAPVGPPPPRR